MAHATTTGGIPFCGLLPCGDGSQRRRQKMTPSSNARRQEVFGIRHDQGGMTGCHDGKAHHRLLRKHDFMLSIWTGESPAHLRLLHAGRPVGAQFAPRTG